MNHFQSGFVLGSLQQEHRGTVEEIQAAWPREPRKSGGTGRRVQQGDGASDKKYPTFYKLGEVKNHDGWDCCDDLEAAGPLLSMGTVIDRSYQLTALSWQVMSLLPQHKASDGHFATERRDWLDDADHD